MKNFLLKLFKAMIEIGNTVITGITIGTTTPDFIDVGSTRVWPDGYYYTLTFKQVDYSSGTRLFATGLNYATFTCYYRKYSMDDTLIETTEVLATPSATYCVASGTQLRWDYDTYKTTVVAANASASVSLSYQGVSCTGTVSIAGNSHSNVYSFTPVVLSATGVTAAGGSLTYTGGEVTTYWQWSSGVQEEKGTDDIHFEYNAPNSQVPSVEGYVDWDSKDIDIPSLGTNTTNSQSYYTFQSEDYGGDVYEFTVYQAKNSRTTNTTIWKVRNATTSQYYEDDELVLPQSPGGSFTIQVVTVTYRRWESGAEQYTTPSVVPLSDYTIEMYDDESVEIGEPGYEGAVTSYDTNPSGGNTIVCYYQPNLEDWTKRTDISIMGNPYGAELIVFQDGID